MDLTLHALGIVCAFASLAFATSGAGRLYTAAAFFVAFVLTAMWTGLTWLPDPTFVGMCVTAVAALQLARAGFFPLTALVGGSLAAVWVSVLRLEGVPEVLALALAVAAPSVSMFLAFRRPAFAPLPLYEEVLLLVAALGLVVAAGPSVASGWQSAALMNIDHGGGPSLDLAPWILLVGSVSLILGGGHSLWWRRR